MYIIFTHNFNSITAVLINSNTALMLLLDLLMRNKNTDIFIQIHWKILNTNVTQVSR